MHTKFQFENLKGRGHLEDPSIDGILKETGRDAMD
jgi:hypothetical protein